MKCDSLQDGFNLKLLKKLQEKMEMEIQKMDGTVITYPKLMVDWPKIQPQIYGEGRPKRQRPTHQGVSLNSKHKD